MVDAGMVTDPVNAGMVTDPVNAVMAFAPSEDKVYEYACHEGNYAMGNILRGARVLESEYTGRWQDPARSKASAAPIDGGRAHAVSG